MPQREPAIAEELARSWSDETTVVSENGARVYHHDLGSPCECGCDLFSVRAYQTLGEGEEWRDEIRVACPYCLPPITKPTFRHSVKVRTPETVIGWIDFKTKLFQAEVTDGQT